MNEILAGYVQKLKEQKKQQKRLTALITAMSVLVSGTVAWQLRGIGAAMTGDEPPDAPVSMAYKTGNTVEFSGRSAAGVEVTVTADEGAFPDGTVMNVLDIPGDEILLTAAEVLNTPALILDTAAVDITFIDPGGSETEPAPGTDTKVRIILPDELRLSGKDYSLLHLDSGGARKVEGAVISDSMAEFDAQSFSIYVMTASGNYADKDEALLLNGQPVPNTESDPYIVRLGENFTVLTVAPNANNSTENDWGYPYGFEKSIIIGGDYLRNDTFTNVGLEFRVIERKFKAVGEGQTKIELYVGGSSGSETLHIKVEPKILVKLPYGDCSNIPSERNRFYPEGTGGSDNQFYLNKGDMLELVYYSSEKLEGYDFGAWTENILDKIGETTVAQEDGYWRYSQFFQAKAVGSDTAMFGKKSIGVIKDSIIVTVTEPADMNVHTATGEKSIDKINEWLDHISSKFRPNVDGYTPNVVDYSHRQNTIGTKNNDTALICAYMMYQGIPAAFDLPSESSDITFKAAKLQTVDARFDTWMDGNSIIEQSPADSSQISLSASGSSVTCTLNSPGFYSLTALKDGKPLRTIYLYGYDTEQTNGAIFADELNHSDMEIEDGGKYTMTEVIVSGTQTKTIVKKYDVLITKINGCTLYDKNGEVAREFLTENYVNSVGNNSGTQYEWTSNPYYTGIFGKTFYGNEIGSVVFDTDLELVPSSQRIIITENGNVVSDTANSITGESVSRQNVIYKMVHQEIIDAYNKCPNHSGFDFTAKSDAAIISFEAKKTLIGETIQPGQYNFEIVDKDSNYRQMITATNDAGGKIEFRNLLLEESRTYHLAMREINDGAVGSVIYDTRSYDLEVEVRKDQSGSLYAYVTSGLQEELNFINSRTYTLPATGGSGVIPFFLTGTALISVAAALLIITRRRERSR